MFVQTNAMALEVESLDGVSIGSSKTRRRSLHGQFHYFRFLKCNIINKWFLKLINYFCMFIFKHVLGIHSFLPFLVRNEMKTAPVWAWVHAAE